MKLRTRMVLSTLAVVVAGAAAVGVVMELSYRHALRSLDEALMVRGVVASKRLARELAKPLAAGSNDQLNRRMADALTDGHDIAGAAVLAPDGAVVARAGTGLPRDLRAAAAPGEKGQSSSACSRCHHLSASARDGRVVSAAEIELDGKRLGAVVAAAEDSKTAQLAGYARLSYLTFLAAVLAIGLGVFVTTGRVFAPLRQVAQVARGVAAGDFQQSEVAVTSNDEVGQMAKDVNHMLVSLRQLAVAADKVAGGDLSVRVELDGPVAAAFNRMVEAQRHLVQQIAETSVQLGSATVQIYAATQEQEAAAAQQAAGVQEVTTSMESLVQSASHIADSAGGVLGYAERNRDTTEATSQRLGELNAHAARMGEILETIREIADRSDLLALNASLEATRAGEAGRAFSLVAGEMRRLAERVTGSVDGVKALVADVRTFGSSTVMAMQEIRRLADDSTGSARQITLVTQQQRSATEQISESMRAIGSVLGQSVTAAQETRSSAQALKSQAEHLAAIVNRFQLEDRAAR